MITLPANATDEEILEVARKWAAALARQDYDAAFAMTTHYSSITSFHSIVSEANSVLTLLDKRIPD
ncbi:hypothetical protein ACFLRT_00545 [Acidobacteriota bacterium]